jgi:hypothetical protein
MSGVSVDVALRADDVPFARMSDHVDGPVVRLDNRDPHSVALFIYDPGYLDALIYQLQYVADAWAAVRSEQVAL